MNRRGLMRWLGLVPAAATMGTTGALAKNVIAPPPPLTINHPDDVECAVLRPGEKVLELVIREAITREINRGTLDGPMGARFAVSPRIHRT